MDMRWLGAFLRVKVERATGFSVNCWHTPSVGGRVLWRKTRHDEFEKTARFSRWNWLYEI
jgi:hypothetical protein